MSDNTKHSPRAQGIIEQPATVDACRRDYQAGAADRATSERQQRHDDRRANGGRS
ncbi:hypothetical protein [Streptomyces sp. NPDC058657]|uniref:hypothetical protein n=1 Tax=unclassified Streptomyces TaxID=2593676 RepID=UPI003647ABD9